MAPPTLTDKSFAAEWGELRGDVRRCVELGEQHAQWRTEHEAADAKTHGDHGARLEHLERAAERAEDRAEITGTHKLAEVNKALDDARASWRHRITTAVALLLGAAGLLSRFLH